MKNLHSQQKLMEAMDLKSKEAYNKMMNLPVAICSKGNVCWLPVHILKREGPITSPSGTEELTPINTYTCGSCGKLIPNTRDIPGVPDITISDCEMIDTTHPDLVKILIENWPGEASYVEPPTFWQALRTNNLRAWIHSIWN